jgi:hypothetical protein
MQPFDNPVFFLEDTIQEIAFPDGNNVLDKIEECLDKIFSDDIDDQKEVILELSGSQILEDETVEEYFKRAYFKFAPSKSSLKKYFANGFMDSDPQIERRFSNRNIFFPDGKKSYIAKDELTEVAKEEMKLQFILHGIMNDMDILHKYKSNKIYTRPEVEELITNALYNDKIDPAIIRLRKFCNINIETNRCFCLFFIKTLLFNIAFSRERGHSYSS